MKTKKSAFLLVNLKSFLVLSLILVAMIALSSCSAGRRASKTATAAAPPPPPPPPVTTGKPVLGEKAGDAYVYVDEMPVFRGGDAALLRFIAENTRYPKAAKDLNIQGKVITRFKVGEDGKVSDVSVLKSVNEFLDKEALRVVSTLPDFTPGKLNGAAVPVWYVIPITFTLKPDGPQRQPRFEVTGSDTIYSAVSEYPVFPGGSEAFSKFKSEKISYPDEIKKLGIEGLVVVRFLIGKDGSVSDTKIIQGVSPSLDADAIRVTRLMPDWQPAKEKGKPVKFLYMTAFEYLLTPPPPPVRDENAPFVVVEEMPMFPGGDSALLAYISKNTKYPESAKTNNIEGRVIVRFCVTDIGSVDRVSVLKGVNQDLDAEAIRVVKTIPTFKPGKQGGKPVNVWYMVPITFGLSKPASEAGIKLATPPPPMPAGYDETPVFKGGEKALYKFINSRLVYPKAAKTSKISGKVGVRFSIGIDGSVGDVSIVKGVNPDLDAEAIRIIKLLPAWKPGKLAGIPVKVWYSIPVTFMPK